MIDPAREIRGPCAARKQILPVKEDRRRSGERDRNSILSRLQEPIPNRRVSEARRVQSVPKAVAYSDPVWTVDDMDDLELHPSIVPQILDRTHRRVGLAFVAVSIPFLAVAVFAGGGEAATIAVSLLVLTFEVGIIAAIGVALSGILSRPLFSVATTYLVVAALVIGTLIAFALVGFSIRSEVTNSYRSFEFPDNYSGESFPCMPGEEPSDDYPCDEDAEVRCGEWQTSTYEVPRFDRVWWLLAANPFVILADATPTQFDDNGNPNDLFGQIKFGVRAAQQPPELEQRWDDCAPDQQSDRPTPEEVIDQTTPIWFVGMALQLLLAAGLMWWAWARTRTPAGRLPSGTRIA